jgi:hypothetical protein
MYVQPIFLALENLPMRNLSRIKRILELRRSNASVPVRNKKKYTRKSKHKKKLID